MLQYAVQAENKSLYNTPPVFAIYIMRLVLASGCSARAGSPRSSSAMRARPEKLYAEIDRTGFYRGHAAPDSRSRMNVTFRLPSEELEKPSSKEATAAGLDGLKGHRSVGGLRASIYNAFPEAGVDALVEFMREFERTDDYKTLARPRNGRRPPSGACRRRSARLVQKSYNRAAVTCYLCPHDRSRALRTPLATYSSKRLPYNLN
jgi:hypothetical protein